MSKTTQIDLAAFDNDQESLAIITEVLARLYFSKVGDKRQESGHLSAAYETAFNLCPNYRLILQKLDGYEKYSHLIPVFAEITSLPVNSKPNSTKFTI